MTREEFEDGLRALGFKVDEDAERWTRPADRLNGASHITFASIRGLLDFGNSFDTYQVLLDSVDSAVHEPGAVDQLADLARSDDGSGAGAGLLVGGETLCRQR